MGVVGVLNVKAKSQGTQSGEKDSTLEESAPLWHEKHLYQQ